MGVQNQKQDTCFDCRQLFSQLAMNFITEKAFQYEKPETNMYFTLMRIFQNLSAQPSLVNSSGKSMFLKIALRQKKKIPVRLHSIWIFKEERQFEITVQLFDPDKTFLEPNPSISVKDLVAQLNRQSLLGTYFTNPGSNSLLRFRHMIPLFGPKTFLCADIEQLYSQISQQFTKYVCKLELIPSPLDFKSEKTAVRFRRLRHLKQHYQKQRFMRKKSIKWYDLTSCHMKVINQVIKLKDFQAKSIISYYQSGQEKMNVNKQKQCKKVYEEIKETIDKELKEENLNNKPVQIAKGIDINEVIEEQKIDEGTYGEIYKGKYLVDCYPTINPTFNFKVEECSTKLLAKKIFKLSQGKDQDCSSKNELLFLRFMRSEKHHRFSGYYFPIYKQNSQNPPETHIFLNYYHSNLKKASSSMSDAQLFRACMQILQGICFLVYKKILHRDLKENNILVDDESNVKFIDFGSCCGSYCDVHQKVEKGNFKAFSNMLMYTPGYCLLYDHAVSTLPFIGDNYTKDQYNRDQTFDVYSFGTIVKNLFGLTHEIPDHLIYRELNYLTSKCHEPNPADRLTAQEAQCYLFQIIQLYRVCCVLDDKEVVKSQNQTGEQHIF